MTQKDRENSVTMHGQEVDSVLAVEGTVRSHGFFLYALFFLDMKQGHAGRRWFVGSPNDCNKA